MSIKAGAWAWDQRVGWPLAKLLLICIGDATVDGREETHVQLGALVEFTGAHGVDEVMGALHWLSKHHLVHLSLYAPVDAAPDLPIGVRACDPDCSVCRDPLPQSVIERAWITARREWDGVRRELTPQVMNRDGAVCRRCAATVDLTIDHVISLREGGTNALENLQVLCRICNTRKGAFDRA